MATNQYGQTYSGNDDFRGWLAAGNMAPVVFGSSNPLLGTRRGNSSSIASLLLQYAGNDGGVGTDNQDIADAARYAYQYWSGQRNGSLASPASIQASSSVNSQGSYNYAAQQAAAEAARKQREAEEKAERERQRMIGYYDNIIKQKNDALNGLSGSLENSLASIRGNYDTYKNELTSSYNKEKSEYDNSSKQNAQALQTNRNTINSNASQGLRGLLRTLGAMGAGGGSVARYNAPEAVKTQADQENANAGMTFAQNQQNLDTDWGNYKNDYDNDKKKLEDWKTGQEKSARQETEKSRISLLEALADAYANRATYDADPGNNINDITNRIKQANQTIRDLGKYATPNYNGVTATFKAPDLASYDTGASDLTTKITGTQETAAESPTSLLTMLRSLRKKDQTSPYSYYDMEA